MRIVFKGKHELNTSISTKKRILVGIPTVLITAGFFIAYWFLFSEHVFLIILLSFLGIGMIAEYFIKIYERKRGKQENEDK